MRVLVVDDDRFLAEDLAGFLGSRGYEAVIVTKKRWREAADEAASLLRGVLRLEDVFDALVLDIAFIDHKLGGAKCYAKLLSDGLRGRFRHLLIWTRYVPTGSSAAGDEYRAIEIFRELSFAPPQNLLPKESKEYDRLLRRLKELATEQHTPVGSYDMWSFH